MFAADLTDVQKAPPKVGRPPEPILLPAADKPTAAHKRHVFNDSLTPLNMAYISRQRINPRTEQELRAACALILQNFKPSDHDIPDADPKLDFRGPHTKRREHRTDASHVEVRRPTGAPQEFKAHYDSRYHHEQHRATSASRSYPDLPMRAIMGRRRVEREKEREGGRERERERIRTSKVLKQK